MSLEIVIRVISILKLKEQINSVQLLDEQTMGGVGVFNKHFNSISRKAVDNPLMQYMKYFPLFKLFRGIFKHHLSRQSTEISPQVF